MNSRKLVALFGFAAAAPSFSPAAAPPPNVVPNPNFAASVSGWAKNSNTSPTGSFTWDASDGWPALGSAHISDPTIGASTIAQTSSCTAITNGNFDLVANVKVSTGTSAYVSVYFFNSSSCSLLNEISSMGVGDFPTAVGNGWMTGSIIDQTPPSIATYAQFSLQGYNPTGPVDAHFDHIVYGLTGIADVLFINGFD